MPTKQFSANAFRALMCAVLLLTAVLILDAVLSVGQRLGQASLILEVLFYVLMALLVVAGIVLPLRRILSNPVRTLDQLYDEDGAASKARVTKFERRLMDLDGFKDKYSQELASLPGDLGERADALVKMYLEHVGPALDARTCEAAKVAFFSTAVSQSPLVDVVTMLSVNFELTAGMVEACGYRPTKYELIKLYARVMGVSLVAGSLEEADLESLFAMVMGGGGASKLSGVALASAAQGIANAFLVFRVGSITRNILLSTKKKDAKELREESYADALGGMKETGFMSKVSAAVRHKAETAASAAVANVRDKASEAGQTVYKGALSALASMGEAVSRAHKAGTAKHTDRGELPPQ